jgi:hypothetical protein
VESAKVATSPLRFHPSHQTISQIKLLRTQLSTEKEVQYSMKYTYKMLKGPVSSVGQLLPRVKYSRSLLDVNDVRCLPRDQSSGPLFLYLLFFFPVRTLTSLFCRKI